LSLITLVAHIRGGQISSSPDANLQLLYKIFAAELTYYTVLSQNKIPIIINENFIILKVFNYSF